MFEAWRTGGDAKRIAPAGSVDWMFAEYKGSNKYTKLPARTRSGYDRAMGDVADYILKDGRRVGELHVKSVNAEFVDKIYDKLKIGPDGTPRNRSALLSITVCKLAWNVVHRNKPAIVPEVNPFKGVDIDYEPKHNRAATLAELRPDQCSDDRSVPSRPAPARPQDCAGADRLRPAGALDDKR